MFFPIVQGEGQAESSAATKKLFVGGIKDEDTEQDVTEMFSNEGVVEKVNMVSDKTTGKQKPFCFVTFEDTDTTDKCVCECSYILSSLTVLINSPFKMTRH